MLTSMYGYRRSPSSRIQRGWGGGVTMEGMFKGQQMERELSDGQRSIVESCLVETIRNHVSTKI